MMQQVKSVLDEMRNEFQMQYSKIDSKIDSLIELQRQHLLLERERLQFEREKAGLPRLPGEFLIHIIYYLS